ncbi:MAG: cellulose biosynthesis cyclic di-GMP-binding regulatory protein BcsB, partial [Algicola sp.]|nr:cellulose biosynthesis cyclic di-GMP-binding regulatory protein BcsB [Algicola sp.]
MFDTQDFTRQPLPFIFPAKRDQKMLRAAGVAASWFGVQAA